MATTNDAPNFPANPTVAKVDASKSTTKHVAAETKPGNGFVDDLDAKQARGYVDAPVALSALPDQVLVQFRVAVSPYAAGEVAGIPKEVAISVLRQGYADLADGGAGPGNCVQRDRSGDVGSLANRPTEATKAAPVDANALQALGEENEALKNQIDAQGSELAELKAQVAALVKANTDETASKNKKS